MLQVGNNPLLLFLGEHSQRPPSPLPIQTTVIQVTKKAGWNSMELRTLVDTFLLSTLELCHSLPVNFSLLNLHLLMLLFFLRS